MELPIGRDIAEAAKILQRAFSAALAEAGGTIATWQVLLALQRRGVRSQQDLARMIGIEGPTLTRQLDALERSGLVVRRRDDHDRRVIRIQATTKGRAQFRQLTKAAANFDKRIRDSLSDKEIEQLRTLLARIKDNASVIA